MKRLLLLTVLYLLSLAAWPQDIYSQGFSPWCLVRDEIEVCNYSTQEICYDIALNAGGYCRENARRYGLKGDEEWCVVSARGRSCDYYSQDQCMKAAMRDNSGCVYNTELALQKSAERKELLGFMVEEQLEESGKRKLADQLQEASAEAEAQQEAASAPGAGGP